ncbi:SusC/RagA family TonB-linked outer membrane protein [Marinilabilia rubra]|uniref:SusC/RagA family TonB-linked outer membrane protein n=2 Tax=Marinilabilia rubra TaxID=2162893 RepID=A0A2U2BCV2_9BACT|nr:SusC/RagA family TonB-linked outer membrane protein [Marinilabilia rubra]
MSYAQPKTISGIVTDASTGEALPGVTIVVKGTTQGTVTDFQGNYNLDVETGETLVFSFIGFSSQEVIVKEQNVVNIQLVPEVTNLDQVVVIGYGSVKKKDLTGAVDLVGSDDFNKGMNTSTQQLVQGKMAGVTVTTNNGSPGGGSDILIRGVGSLNLTSNPLYVVDGLPLDVREPIGDEPTETGVKQRGVRNPLNLINPNDIESITVLKDASATAIYGSRAANGVVVITTKSGSHSDKLKFNFNSQTTISMPDEYLDIFTADEFRAVINSTNDPVLIDQLGSHDTDWQELIYDNAIGTDNSFSASGKAFGTPLRASVGYTNEDGILQGDNFERITGSLNIAPKFFDNKLKFNLSAKLMHTENEFANQRAIFNSATFNPTWPVYDSNSPFGYTTYLNNEGTLKLKNSPWNPQALLDLVSNNSAVNRYVTNLKMDYKVPFIEGMTATINTGFDIVDSDGEEVTDPKAPTESEGFNGIKTEYGNSTTNLLFDAYVNYSREILKNNLSVTAGYSYQSFDTEDSFIRTDYFLDDQGNNDPDAAIMVGFEDEFESTLLSYFGRLNYDVKGKYLLTGTLRADASSKLNPDDRWGLFPSLALAWNLHKENFIREGFINSLKLRVGYGEVGNVNGLGDYTFLTRYFQSGSNAKYQIGNNFITTYRPEPINDNLRWEVGSTWNAGIDYVMWNRRVSGSLNVYLKKTKDMIAEAIVDPLTNFGNSISDNIGNMENKGIEFDINGVVVSREDLKFEIGYNIAVNDNEITKLNNPQEVGPIGGTLGDKIQRHEVGKAPYAFYVYKQLYNEDGKPIEGAFEDLDGDGEITIDDRYFYKDPFADITMGFNMNLVYKNFDFNLSARASFDNYVYNNNAAIGALQRFTNLDIVRNGHSSFFDTEWEYIDTQSMMSDHWIENASFLRLDNVSVGYTFEKLLKNSSLRLFATGSNLLVISDYNGIDPEIFNGIDNNIYPRPKVLSFGVDFNF